MMFIAQQIRLLLEWEMDGGYISEPAKSIFIAYLSDQEEGEIWAFVAEGLQIKFVSISQYLGVYIGSKTDLEEWVYYHVYAWYHGDLS